MIRRETQDVDLLITQTDHARLAGQLLEHWGNHQFERPESAAAPWASVIRGAALHDAGWPLHDDQPTLNPAGRPLDVFETPWPIALRVWQASADRAAAADPYAGLLTSLHVLALADQLARQPHPDPHDTAAPDRAALFAINKFIHREIERQEQLRAALSLPTTTALTLGLAPAGASRSHDLLRLHLRALQAADAISVALCCTHPSMPQTHALHASLGTSPLPLRITRDASATLQVHPWAFDADHLQFQVSARRLPAQPWPTQAVFETAYVAAPIESLSLRIAPSHSKVER